MTSALPPVTQRSGVAADSIPVDATAYPKDRKEFTELVLENLADEGMPKESLAILSDDPFLWGEVHPQALAGTLTTDAAKMLLGEVSGPQNQRLTPEQADLAPTLEKKILASVYAGLAMGAQWEAPGHHLARKWRDERAYRETALVPYGTSSELDWRLEQARSARTQQNLEAKEYTKGLSDFMSAPVDTMLHHFQTCAPWDRPPTPGAPASTVDTLASTAVPVAVTLLATGNVPLAMAVGVLSQVVAGGAHLVPADAERAATRGPLANINDDGVVEDDDDLAPEATTPGTLGGSPADMDDGDGTVADDHAPCGAELGQTGPNAAFADLIDLYPTIVEPPSTAKGRRRRVANESDDWTPLPHEPVNADDAVFQEFFLADVRSRQAPPRKSPSELQAEITALVDEQIARMKQKVQSSHDRLMRGRVPAMDTETTPNDLATALNTLVHLETLEHRYNKPSPASAPGSRHHLPHLSERERYMAAKEALRHLDNAWKEASRSDEDVVLGLLGTHQNAWFAQHKNDLAGKTCAQALIILTARCRAALPHHLQPLPKQVLTAACVQSLAPELLVLPGSTLAQMDWAGQKHLSLRIGYQGLPENAIPDTPIEAEQMLVAAELTITGEMLHEEMESVGIRHSARERAVLTGRLGHAGQSDAAEDAVIDSIVSEMENSPKARQMRELGKVRAALADPPPSLASIAAAYARRHISGRDTVTVMEDEGDPGAWRRLGLGNAPKQVSLLNAFLQHGKNYATACEERCFQVRLKIEVDHSKWGPKGYEVVVNSEELFHDYRQLLEDYYHKVEQGAHAQLTLHFDLHGEVKGIMVPNINNPHDRSTITLPKNVMIVLLQSEGAQQPRPFRLEFKGGRQADLSPMPVTAAEINAHQLDTPENKALHYIGTHMGEFPFRRSGPFERSDLGIEEQMSGTPDALRMEIFSKLGWKQKFDQAREEARASLQGDNPAVQQLPLYGCVRSIQDVLSDHPPLEPAYDADLGTQSTATPAAATTAAPDQSHPSDPILNAFKTGLSCGLEAMEMVGGIGAVTEGAIKLGGKAGKAFAARRLASHQGRSSRPVFQDILKKGKNGFMNRLPHSAGKNRISEELDNTPYRSSIQTYKHVKTQQKIAQLTADGTTLKAGVELPSHALVRGQYDDKQYLQATGGEKGGVFLDGKTRKFMRKIGTADAYYYAEVDLNTPELKSKAQGYKAAPPNAVGVSKLGQVKAEYYEQGGTVWLNKGGRLRKAKPNEVAHFRDRHSVLKRDNTQHADGIPRYHRDGQSGAENTYYRLTLPDGSVLMAPPAGSKYSYKVPMLAAIGPEQEVIPFRWDETGSMSSGNHDQLFVKKRDTGNLYKLTIKNGQVHLTPATSQFAALHRTLSCAPSFSLGSASQVMHRRQRRVATQNLQTMCAAGEYNRHKLLAGLHKDLAQSNPADKAELEKDIRCVGREYTRVADNEEFSDLIAIVSTEANALKTGSAEHRKVYSAVPKPPKKNVSAKAKANARPEDNYEVISSSKQLEKRNVAAFDIQVLDGDSQADPSVIKGGTSGPKLLISGALTYDVTLLPEGENWANDIGPLAAMKAAGKPNPGKPPQAIERAGDTEFKALHNVEAYMQKLMKSVDQLANAGITNPDKILDVKIRFHPGLPPCPSCNFNMNEYKMELDKRIEKFNERNLAPGANGIRIRADFAIGGYDRNLEAGEDE